MNPKPRRQRKKSSAASRADGPAGLEKALDFHRKGNLKAASRIYRKVLSTDPCNALVLNLSGVIAHQTGNDKLALKHLERALEIEPENDSFHNNIGEVFRSNGEMDKALEHFRRCLEINPDDHSAHNNMGNIFLQRKDYAKAAECFSESLMLQPNFFKAAYNLGLTYLEMGRLGDAIAPLKNAVSLDPSFTDGHAKLGEVLFLNSRFAEALPHFQHALDHEQSLSITSTATILNNMAGALKRLHRTDEGTAYFRNAVSRDPNNPALRANLASWLEEINKPEEALREAEQALSVDPGNVKAGVVLARIDHRADKLEKSRKRLEAVLETSPKDPFIPSVYMDLGRIYDRLGKSKKAFPCWTEGNRRLAATDKWQRVDKNSFLQLVDALNNWASSANPIKSQNVSKSDITNDPIFLVGFPRSGTTLLEHIIAAGGYTVSDERPFIPTLRGALSQIMGNDFRYPDDIVKINSDAGRRLREFYWNLVKKFLDVGPAEIRLLDKMPLNICDLGLIERVFPDARILVVLRDPRDSCLSNFMQNFEPDSAMASFLSLDSTVAAYAGVMGLWLKYRKILSLPFLEVRYEDLVDDFEETARAVMDFIGAPWSDSIFDFHKFAGKKQISTPSVRDVAKPIFSRAVGRWRQYEEHLRPVLPVLEPFVSAFGYEDPDDVPQADKAN